MKQERRAEWSNLRGDQAPPRSDYARDQEPATSCPGDLRSLTCLEAGGRLRPPPRGGQVIENVANGAAAPKRSQECAHGPTSRGSGAVAQWGLLEAPRRGYARGVRVCSATCRPRGLQAAEPPTGRAGRPSPAWVKTAIQGVLGSPPLEPVKSWRKTWPGIAAPLGLDCRVRKKINSTWIA